MATVHEWWILLAVCFVAGVIDANLYFPTQERKKCIHTKVHKLSAADCHGINLPGVPKHLNTGIEILDLSYNRIRKLHNKDFNNYPYLKYLYLGDNAINYIENETFSSLPYLEVLNMSLNSMHHIPRELFHLNGLRKLTMDFNHITQEGFDELQFLEILPNIKYLSLSNCMLKEFPPLHKFPHIEFLNVSGNLLSTITAQQLAPACMLKVIDVSENKELHNMPACACAGLKVWSGSRGIAVHPDLSHICPPLENGLIEACNVTLKDTEHVYSTCRDLYHELQVKAAWTHYGIILLVGSFVLLVAVSIVLGYYRLCCRSSNVGHDPSGHNDRNNLPGEDIDLLTNSNHTEI